MLGDSLRRRRGPDRSPGNDLDRPRRRPRRPRCSGGALASWQKWLIAALVIGFGSFGVGYLLSTQVLFPRPDTAGTGIVTPSLYGERRDAAERAIREAGLEVGEVIELASAATERGRVLAQDPIPGQQLRRGAAVSMAVSAGRPELTVPPVAGMRQSTARELLEGVGFEVAVQLTEGRAMEGVVLGTRPEAGMARTLPAVVTLLVSSGAPEQDDPELTPPSRRPDPGAGAPPVPDPIGPPR